MKLRTLFSLSLCLALVAGTTFVGSVFADDEVALPTAVPVTTSVSPTPSSVPSVSRSSASLSRKLQPQSVTINLLDGMKLSGQLTQDDQWTMKTSFGTTSLPLSTVAGMRMAQEGDAITTVVLHNGDQLTGAVNLDLVVIETEWGRAEINGNHISSILFTPGLKWTAETGLNGMRWKLVADEPPRVAPAAQAAPGRPVPGQPIPGQPIAGQPTPGQPGQPGRPGVQSNLYRPAGR